MTYDSTRERLLIQGGGHADYFGNEIYAINVGLDIPTVERWTDPSSDVSAPSPATDGDYPDGLPASFHSYDIVEYAPISDELISAGHAFVYNTRGDGFGIVWHFDCSVTTANLYQRALDAWSKSSADYTTMQNASGGHAGFAYSPKHGKVFMLESGSFPAFGGYDPLTQTLTKHIGAVSGTTFPSGIGTYVAGEVVPSGNKDYYVAACSLTDLAVIDLDDFSQHAPTVTNPSKLSGSQPMTYDPVNACIWSWATGNNLVSLPVPANPDTDTWVASDQALTGTAMPTPQANGTFSRLRYYARGGMGAVLLVNSNSEDTFAIRVH